MQIHYLEIVTTEVDAVCTRDFQILERSSSSSGQSTSPLATGSFYERTGVI
jgi:hypothetical protein